MAAGLYSVEGTALSQIDQVVGLGTGLSVLDDFLPWQGLPVGGLTLLEGPQAPRLARKLSARLRLPSRALWIHSMKLRPFFHESDTCFRLQIPEEADLMATLPSVLRDPAFSCVIIQLSHPLSRVKALELSKIVKSSGLCVVVIARSERSIPWELCDLVIESNEDYLAIRRAQHRPVPLWIPVEMIDLSPGAQESPVINWWNALELQHG